jgi:hypothetical protein
LQITLTAFCVACLVPANLARTQQPEGELKKVNEPIAWEILFADETTAEEYARQLEYFKIEVAAVSADGRVEYISRLTDRKPLKHVGKRSDDPRRYLGWKAGKLHAVDRRLLSKAGITTNRKELTHYIPAETQAVMEQLERAYGNREPSEIRRTRFAIRPVAGGRYEFFVVEQDPPRDDGDEPQE